MGLEEQTAFHKELSAAVAAQKELFTHRRAFCPAAVLDDQRDGLRLNIHFLKPHHRQGAGSKEAVQGDVRMGGIPQPLRRNEAFFIHQSAENFADEGLAVLSAPLPGFAPV